MKKRRSRIPGIVWFGIGLTFFNSWVLFEELVIDRFGLWRYLPYYIVGKLCVWDVMAIVVISAAFTLLSRSLRVRLLGSICPRHQCGFCS